jgi:hypothetical protein
MTFHSLSLLHPSIIIMTFHSLSLLHPSIIIAPRSKYETYKIRDIQIPSGMCYSRVYLYMRFWKAVRAYLAESAAHNYTDFIMGFYLVEWA